MRNKSLKFKFAAVGMAAIISACTFLPSITVQADAAPYDISQGNITITVTSEGQTVTVGYGTPEPNDSPVIVGSTQSKRIIIETVANTEANITLGNGLHINNGGYAAIEVRGDGTANIEIDGSVDLYGGSNHAGIEVNDACICINDGNGVAGTLEVYGGTHAAGIGSGESGFCGSITINGGTIHANGAPGIGTAKDGSGGDIIITGGVIESIGSNNNPGIGAGASAGGTTIRISGGTVTARGGSNAAGIGSGTYGLASSVTITGGIINAYGGSYGAGIGSGTRGDIYDISISGNSTVTAVGGEYAAGIGTGYDSDISFTERNITIGSGTVTAIGGNGAAGIGTGVISALDNVEINNIIVCRSAVVSAAGGTAYSGDGVNVSDGPAIGHGSDTSGNGVVEFAAENLVTDNQSFTGAIYYYPAGTTAASITDGSATYSSSYSAPVEPSPSVSPSASAQPSTPVSPSASVQPSAPVDPSASIEPSASAEPSASVEPTSTANPSASVEPTASEEPSPSVEPSQSVDPVEPVSPIVPQIPASTIMSDLSDELSGAIARGGEQTIYWNRGNKLSYDIMKMLEEHPDLTVVFTYSYMDKDYTVTIHGKDVKANPLIPWYGPVYLYTNYGAGVPADDNTVPNLPGMIPFAPNGTYTVAQGDTLGAIAERLSTTVEYLALLNDISDPDIIYVGQIIVF